LAGPPASVTALLFVLTEKKGHLQSWSSSSKLDSPTWHRIKLAAPPALPNLPPAKVFSAIADLKETNAALKSIALTHSAVALGCQEFGH
jgi:hypothetical protein